MSSIERIQDKVESLTVLIFEAVRNYADKDPLTKETMSASIKSEYKAAIIEIEGMSGAGRSINDQESELNELSAKHSQLKNEILQIQQKLQSLNDACSSELTEILNDPLCKCERS